MNRPSKSAGEDGGMQGELVYKPNPRERETKARVAQLLIEWAERETKKLLERKANEKETKHPQGGQAAS